ncbi:unnamed protein product [Bathycoccus prasinos]
MYPVLLSLRIVRRKSSEAILFATRKHETNWQRKEKTWYSMSADSRKRSVENLAKKRKKKAEMSVKRVFDYFGQHTHAQFGIVIRPVPALFDCRKRAVRDGEYHQSEEHDDDDDVMFSASWSRLEILPDLTSYVENDDENFGNNS